MKLLVTLSLLYGGLATYSLTMSLFAEPLCHLILTNNGGPLIPSCYGDCPDSNACRLGSMAWGGGTWFWCACNDGDGSYTPNGKLCVAKKQRL